MFSTATFLDHLIHNRENGAELLDVGHWDVEDHATGVTTRLHELATWHNLFDDLLDLRYILLIADHAYAVAFTVLVLKLLWCADTFDFAVVEDNQLVAKKFGLLHCVS